MRVRVERLRKARGERIFFVSRRTWSHPRMEIFFLLNKSISVLYFLCGVHVELRMTRKIIYGPNHMVNFFELYMNMHNRI